MAKNLEVSLLMDFYGAMLTDKQREMIEHYYNDDLSLAEIAENEGITRQGVRDIIKRAEGQLFDMEDKLRFVSKSRREQVVINEIKASIVEISEYNLRYGGSKEIGDAAKHVYDLAEQLV